MDSIIWAIKHTMRDIADVGLSSKYIVFEDLHFAQAISLVCLDTVNHFDSGDPTISAAFFKQYYLDIVQDIYFVLTDTDHKSGFRLQSVLLARMYQLVETDRIRSPLFDTSTIPNPNVTNSMFMREYTAHLLKTAFPHVQQ
jgi:exportin-1